jgi:hypothetical protein
MTELEASETRAAALAYMRGETEHEAPTPAESAKEAAEEKDASLHVAYILNTKPEAWSQSDRDYLALEILRGIKNGL